MNSAKLLSIAIPTRNSPHTLVQTLQSLKDQNLVDYSFVEIVISDNNSTSETKNVVESFIQTSNFEVRYFRSESDLSYDDNILKLVNLCQGTFVKIIADDDLLPFEYLNFLFTSLILNPNIVLLISDFEIWDKDISFKISEGIFPRTQTVVLNKFEDALAQSKGRYGQVSTLAFSRKHWEAIDSQLAIGSNYIHMHKALLLMAAGPVLLDSSFLLIVREGSPNFSSNLSRLVKVPFGAISMFESLFGTSVPTKSVKKLIKEQVKYVSWQLLSATGKGQYFPFEFKLKLFIKILEFPALWPQLVPVFWLPKQILNFMQNLRNN